VAEVGTAHVQGRPLGEILLEIKDELLEFVETRLRLLHSEFEETLQSARSSLPLLVATIILLGTAYLLLVAALVGLVSFAFINSPSRWPLSFLIVGSLWLIAGLVTAVLARNSFRDRGSFPKKTIEVLKADGLWIHDEGKHIA
jgi:VIT1/CCC1 family predicted Fe2+/Mn2+ transporter